MENLSKNSVAEISAILKAKANEIVAESLKPDRNMERIEKELDLLRMDISRKMFGDLRLEITRPELLDLMVDFLKFDSDENSMFVKLQSLFEVSLSQNLVNKIEWVNVRSTMKGEPITAYQKELLLFALKDTVTPTATTQDSQKAIGEMLNDLSDNVINVIQKYYGKSLTEIGCSSWTEVHSKLEEEVNSEFSKFGRRTKILETLVKTLASNYSNLGNPQFLNDLKNVQADSVSVETLRNKLTPVKNLIAMIENGLAKGTAETHDLVIREVEQCKKNIANLLEEK